MSMKTPQLLWSEHAVQTMGLFRGQGERACGVTEGEAPEGAYPTAGLFVTAQQEPSREPRNQLVAN